VGPQWTVHTDGRWSPHAHFRVGGQTITEEKLNPELEKLVLSKVLPGADKHKYHDLYTQYWGPTRFSIAVGGGLDIVEPVSYMPEQDLDAA
jgi:hypothetical protein